MEKLLLSKEELFSVLDSIHEGVEICTSEGIIIYINDAYKKLTGLSEKNRIGVCVFNIAPQGALASVLRTGKSIIGYTVNVSGSNVKLTTNTVPLKNGGELKGAVAVIQDITETVELGEKVKASSESLRGLQEKINELMSAHYSFYDLIGNSSSLQKAIKIAKKVAKTNATVILTGESGTGKELFAHALHNDSNRYDKPFVRINCAAIPDNLLESELFGHEKGAFTGAVERKQGLFELAINGTILLDEVSDMSLGNQAKLLRVVQEKEFTRIGGTNPLKTNVRLLVATNRDLISMVGNGKFRQDLFYRLNVVSIEVPPLRERKDDIQLLVSHFIEKFNKKMGKTISGVKKEVLDDFYSYNWPGNVRELEHTIERAIIVCEGDVITENDVFFKQIQIYKRPISTLQGDEIFPLNEVEKIHIVNALKKYGNNYRGKLQAANDLNISITTLYNKINKYKLLANDYS
jgi:PAS domain S-box-containing protein